MRIIGRSKLLKLKKKNMGNDKLIHEINLLLHTRELFNPQLERISDVRKDADCVHSDGFYFFNIQMHRTMILMVLDEEGEATIVWAGKHQEYETTFKNNKKTIEKWLRKNGYIY
jgi:hypothetical protein